MTARRATIARDGSGTLSVDDIAAYLDTHPKLSKLPDGPAKTDLRNIPRKENLALGGLVNPWGHPTPAVYDPECFYWENPS